MMDLQNLTFPRRAMYYLALALITVAVIFFLAILPAWDDIDRLELKIKENQVLLEEQQILFPVYSNLMSIVDSTTARKAGLEDKGSNSSQVNVDQGIRMLNVAALEAGFVDVSFSPVPASYSQSGSRIMVNAVLKGSYQAVYEFLAELALKPFFLEYQQFEIRSRPDEFRVIMEIWIAVD
ncbi:hypothetical protein [Desulfonatronovibrio magnus]|uniref:hypothetical protein n=1 Tax=Desulfonatronovibrio magnus TaxID=698827 RepID=UPI0005EAE4E8|nr:hypothetical protein [Desulfonatronovibrio magnus]